MKRIFAACFAAVLLTWTVTAEDGPQMPKPGTEHDWLKQLEGEWEGEGEFFSEPGKPSFKAKSTETTRNVGGFWSITETKGEAMGQPFTGIMTLGYDPAKKAYMGTWIDSMSSTMWRYEGSVDAGGKVLTLRTEGPAPWDEKKTAKFEESIEVKDKDHKTFMSKIERDGEWVTLMKIEYTRKK
jgi:hypothetical protein